MRMGSLYRTVRPFWVCDGCVSFNRETFWPLTDRPGNLLFSFFLGVSNNLGLGGLPTGIHDAHVV